MNNYKALIVNSPVDSQYGEIFQEAICIAERLLFKFKMGAGINYIPLYETNNPQYDKDVVAIHFTGGEDVHPSFYGEEPDGNGYYNKRRDNQEAIYYTNYASPDILKLGICRGSQFLNVMNGGKLHQHIEGHAIGGTHPVQSVNSGTFWVTSTHHQASILGEGGELLAWGEDHDDRHSRITEAYEYRLTNTFGVQFHPEYMPKDSPARVYYVESVAARIADTIKRREGV